MSRGKQWTDPGLKYPGQAAAATERQTASELSLSSRVSRVPRDEAAEELKSRGVEEGAYDATLLSLCCSEETLLDTDSVQTVAWLASGLANLDCRGSANETPLISAAILGSVDVCKLLLEAGADPNAPGLSEDRSPLLVSTMQRVPEITELLVEYGADVNFKDNTNRTALMGAAFCGSLPTCELLLERGANICDKDDMGKSALICAFVGQSTDIVKLFMDRAGMTVPDIMAGDCNPLLISAVLNCKGLLDMLIAGGADVNSVDEDNWTPLMGAVQHIDVCRALIAAGADVNHTDTDGRNALMCAVMEHCIDTVHLLLENGANIDDKDKMGNTALHITAREGNEEMALKLMQAGASIDALDNEGFAPLHFAAKQNNPHLTLLLLTRGAKVSMHNGWGHSALMMACFMGHADVMRILLAHGADPNTHKRGEHGPLMLAAASGFHTCTNMLLEKRAAVDEADTDGWTALMVAVVNQHHDVAETLMRRTQRCLTLQTAEGYTLYQSAALQRDARMLALLAGNGVSKHALGPNESCPCRVCVRKAESSRGAAAVSGDAVQDARTDSPRSVGGTVWHSACSKQHTVCVT